MSDLSIEITGFVVGDDLEIRRTVTDLPAEIEVAWLTVKRYAAEPDASARLQKRITTDDEAGVGQIVDPGGCPGDDGDLRFDLTGADTELLGAARHVYDIQVKLVTGCIYTVEKGTIELTRGVTGATT